jgi:hypothetical protein
MKTRDDDLRAAKGIINALLLSVPIWFFIIGLAFLVLWVRT